MIFELILNMYISLTDEPNYKQSLFGQKKYDVRLNG